MALNRQRAYTFTYYISIAIRVPVTIWWLMEDGLRGAMLAMLATAVVNAVLWNFQLRSMLKFPLADGDAGAVAPAGCRGTDVRRGAAGR